MGAKGTGVKRKAPRPKGAAPRPVKAGTAATAPVKTPAVPKYRTSTPKAGPVAARGGTPTSKGGAVASPAGTAGPKPGAVLSTVATAGTATPKRTRRFDHVRLRIVRAAPLTTLAVGTVVLLRLVVPVVIPAMIIGTTSLVTLVCGLRLTRPHLAGAHASPGDDEYGKFLLDLASNMAAGLVIALALIPSDRRQAALEERRAAKEEMQFALADQNLSDIDLSGRSLRELILVKKDLTGARFEGATLDTVRFDQAKLAEAVFDQAALNGVVFSGVIGPKISFACDPPAEPERCTGARLENVRFLSGARVEDANFTNAVMRNLSFADTDLRRARFIDATGGMVRFDNVDLRGANFSQAAFDAEFGAVCIDATTIWGSFVPPAHNQAACQ